MTGSYPAPDDRDGRPPRRYSIWTLLAPAALLLVVIMIFNAVGESCLVRSCDKTTTTSTKKQGAKGSTAKSDPATTTRNGKPRQIYKVVAGDTAQLIADRFDLTLQELENCNPNISDFYSLQPGQYLRVSPGRCKTTSTTSTSAL